MLHKISDKNTIRLLFADIQRNAEQIDSAFSLSFVDNPGYMAFFLLNENRKSVLEFNIVRELGERGFTVGGKAGRPSAAFVTDGSRTWVAHTGKVHHKKPKFSEGDVPVNDNGKIEKYHIISSANDKRFLLDVIAFHLSRLDGFVEFLPDIQTDSGPSSKFAKRASESDPKHHLIVGALKDYLSKEGFSGWHNPTKIRLDCAAAKGKICYIFEVKPKTNFNSMCEAVGQLTGYDYLTARSSKLVMVSPNHGMNDVIRKCLERLNVSHFGCDLQGTHVSFTSRL